MKNKKYISIFGASLLIPILGFASDSLMPPCEVVLPDQGCENGCLFEILSVAPIGKTGLSILDIDVTNTERPAQCYFMSAEMLARPGDIANVLTLPIKGSNWTRVVLLGVKKHGK